MKKFERSAVRYFSIFLFGKYQFLLEEIFILIWNPQAFVASEKMVYYAKGSGFGGQMSSYY